MAYPNQPTQPYTGQVPVPGAYQFGPGGQEPPTQALPQYHPVQETDKDPYAPTTWGQFNDFTCPSGQRCALRPIDLSELLSMGLLEDINALTGIVEKDVIRPAQGLPPMKTESLLKDGNRVSRMMQVVDQIVCAVVARPSLTSAYDENGKKIPEVNRKAGLVYVDSVGLPDRIAIFNESLKGVADLESFRKAAAESGGSVVGQQGGFVQAERGVRDQG